jgi:hypothetical protein
MPDIPYCRTPKNVKKTPSKDTQFYSSLRIGNMKGVGEQINCFGLRNSLLELKGACPRLLFVIIVMRKV